MESLFSKFMLKHLVRIAIEVNLIFHGFGAFGAVTASFDSKNVPNATARQNMPIPM